MLLQWWNLCQKLKSNVSKIEKNFKCLEDLFKFYWRPIFSQNPFYLFIRWSGPSFRSRQSHILQIPYKNVIVSDRFKLFAFLPSYLVHLFLTFMFEFGFKKLWKEQWTYPITIVYYYSIYCSSLVDLRILIPCRQRKYVIFFDRYISRYIT